jgi:hypothetical protein
MATNETRNADEGRGHAKEYSHDWSHGCRKDRGSAKARQAGRGSLYQGGSDEVYGGWIPWQGNKPSQKSGKPCLAENYIQFSCGSRPPTPLANIPVDIVCIALNHVWQDVDTIIKDLVDVAINLQRTKMKEQLRAEVSAAVENRILDILAGDSAQPSTRDSFRTMLKEVGTLSKYQMSTSHMIAPKWSKHEQKKGHRKNKHKQAHFCCVYELQKLRCTAIDPHLESCRCVGLFYEMKQVEHVEERNFSLRHEITAIP